MVKNIPTIERSTKIRFGKHANDNQAENSIVFNASNEAISASIPGAVYMTPLRQASVGGATFVGYDATTKEVVDTNVLTSLLGGISLDEASKQGNVVTNTSPHFAHTVTAFTTRYGSNVGIANTSPIHALDVGENLHITRHGNVITSGKITAGQFYGDGGTLSNIQVGLDDVIVYSNTAASKTVEFNYASGPSLITAGKVGISNANPTHTLDVGSNLYVEDTAADVLNVTGNVNVSNYLKTNKLEVSSLEVDAVTAGTVSSNIIGDNVNVNTITTNVVSLNSISPGDILVGPSSGTVLAKLAAYAPVAGSTVPTSWGTGSNSSSGNTASSSDSSANAYKAFDGSDSTNYVSPLAYSYSSPYGYTGSNSLGGVNGEWVKIQLASAITPTSVFVKARPDNSSPDWAVRPNSWRILGSTDGTNWIQLHASTTLVDDTNGTTESFTNTTAYSYIAFVVTNINNPGSNDARWTLSRLSFTSSQIGPTEKFLRSSAAGVSWDEVSSTLQTITDGGASTNNEISFTNGVTSLTASGNVVVSGNVTTGTPIAIASGGTGLNSFTENDLLLGPSSGDALAKLSAYTGPTSITAPPSGMSSTTQTIGGIQYTSSASTTGSGTATNNAFDHDNATIWRSANDPGESYDSMDGYYSGSNTTGSYSGAWIQLYRATAIAPTSIQIIASQTTSIPAPNVWKVFGSTNGSSWTEIHSSSTAVTWNSGNGHTATISGSAAYNYLRLAVQQSTMASSMGTIAVSEVRFSSQGTGPTEKFLRSSAAGVSWDAVSSTLQTITDGGASTTNEVSFTNGVTSLTASGNVVVTGNVTASNIISTNLTSGKIPYTDANNELIDSKVSFNTTTNVTSVASNLVVTGNLTVQGGTIYQDTDVHTITDPIIELGNANAIDTIDMGIIMTRPTANVAAGYRGDEKEYTIAYTLSDPDGSHIVPTNATSDGYITANVWGNVVAGNVTTTGKVTADAFHGEGSFITGLNLGSTSMNSGSVPIALGGTGVTTGLTALDPANLSSQVLLAKGGTGLTSVAENELLLGPASGTALSTLSPHTAASKKFLRSDAAGIAWDDVSSNLQAITEGGASTTETVTFNNTTTGLISAGDIDIAATKQIDYAGDVLIKSSAGAVASFKVDNAIKLDPSYASSSHNVLSINTTTGEIYDSGGQGGSSFNNIREEGANVSIGPTASTNLTVNTFGSNVLSVSGNVSADNITIGSLHVSASPFNFDDVVSASAGANVTSNVITIGGLVTSGNVEAGNVEAGNVIVTGNTTSQNIKLTNTDISAAISSGTITIDAREKSYGTAPLVTSTTDVSNLVFSNLISGSQIVVPILASGGNIKISKELTNVNFYAMTTDVSVSQDKHALMTLSNVSGNIYMNALAFA